MKKNTAIRFLEKYLQQTNTVLMLLKQERQLITGRMMKNGGRGQKKMAYM
ncbi:hypothetical protein ES703_38740 [subsurface metagenome]